MGTTPGYKTKAFWAVLAGNILAGAMALGYGPDTLDAGNIGKAVGLAAAALASLGYAVNRGAIKLGNPTKAWWKQTEFWLSSLSILISTLMASGLFSVTGRPYEALAAVTSILVMLGYGKSQNKTTAPELAEGPYTDQLK